MNVKRDDRWDLSKDGRRLLLVKGSNVQTTSQLNVVVNWFEELKRLVPGGE